MATRLKSNRKIRIFLTILLLAALTAGNVAAFPKMLGQAEEIRKQSGKEPVDSSVPVDIDLHLPVDMETIDVLYHGCYVLYARSQREGLEIINRETAFEQGRTGEEDVTGNIGLFFPANAADGELQATAKAFAAEKLQEWEGDFFGNENFEYYAVASNDLVQTNSPGLGKVESDVRFRDLGYPSNPQQEAAERDSSYCFHISFDDGGNATVEFLLGDSFFEEDGDICTLTDILTEYQKEQNLGHLLAQELGISDSGMELAGTVGYQPIRNYDVYFAIPSYSDRDFLAYVDPASEEYMVVSVLPFVINVLALLLGMALLTSRKIWKDIPSYDHAGTLCSVEMGIFGLICSVSLFPVYVACLTFFEQERIQDLGKRWPFHYVDLPEVIRGGALCLGIGGILLVIYLTLLCFRPLFSVGIVGYIRRYSWIYRLLVRIRKSWRGILRGMRQKWRDFVWELHHLDFTERSTKTILKVVLINFAVLVVLVCIWLFGLIGLVVYSLVLFWLLKRYYDRIFGDYQKLLAAMNRMAEGDLSEPAQEDMGIFDPLQEELTRIRGGFRKAVDEETKSQRMKTDLISNVSHDLKTPLTAITTYVELLKKPDITPEERADYIDTLERKAFRLKVLIEDLFEVSKAQSANVSLDLMEVDLVNLIRQVAVEHREKLAEEGLELRWKVPEGKVSLELDAQKTYRVFENLFVNLEKYAMPNSRVYVEIAETDDEVRTVIKNMSATELNVAPEELTERFVRGDASRNTEGSGLGLAIARSFTELQKGTFAVDVDGDLFKVTLVWKKDL